MTRGRCAIRALLSSRSRVAALAVALAAVTSTSHDARADEGGISMWLPGLFGSLAAAPQVPGWAVGIVYYHTSISAEGSVAAAREVTIGKLNPTINVNLDLNLKASADLVVIDPSYTFATPVFGGQFNVNVAGFVGRTTGEISGTLTATCGTFRRDASRQHQRLVDGPRRPHSANVAAVELRRQQLDGLRDGGRPGRQLQFQQPREPWHRPRCR